MRLSDLGKTFKAVAKGFSGEKGPHEYTINEILIKCPFCSNNKFYSGSAQLNTARMSLLNLDWANKSATTLTCLNCTNIQWFMYEPTRM